LQSVSINAHFHSLDSMLQFTIRHALSQSLRFPLNPLLSQVSCDAPSQLSPPLTSRVAGRHGPQAALRKRTPSPARARAVPRAGAPRARAQPCRPSTSTPAPHAVASMPRGVAGPRGVHGAPPAVMATRCARASATSPALLILVAMATLAQARRTRTAFAQPTLLSTASGVPGARTTARVAA